MIAIAKLAKARNDKANQQRRKQAQSEQHLLNPSSLLQLFLMRSPTTPDLSFALLCGTCDPSSPISRVDQNILSMIMDLVVLEWRSRARLIDLVEAARHGRLLQLRAKLHLTDVDVDSPRDRSDSTAVYLAAANGRTKVLELLLHSGADPNAVSKSGLTAVHQAARKGHTKALQLLLHSGANHDTADPNGWTAVFWAAADGHTKALQLLLQSGADPNAVAKDGDTPVSIASHLSHHAAAALLKVYGGRAATMASASSVCDAWSWNISADDQATSTIPGIEMPSEEPVLPKLASHSFRVRTF